MAEEKGKVRHLLALKGILSQGVGTLRGRILGKRTLLPGDVYLDLQSFVRVE